MAQAPFPPIPEVLLKALEARFRDTIPMSAGLDELRVLQGEQTVVRFLRCQFDIQNRTILNKD